MWFEIMVFGVLTAIGTRAETSCDLARAKCVNRDGCRSALDNYLLLCNDVLAEPTEYCPKSCEHALIALLSTEEGKVLMRCQCQDDYCAEAKQRIEVCRSQVLKETNATESCHLSQLICLADSECAAALSFYHRLCRAMFMGRKCSKKCRNSIEILKKQEKAAALTKCQCDGYEEFDCPKMQVNLQRLCYHKHSTHREMSGSAHILHKSGLDKKKNKFSEKVEVRGAADHTVSSSFLLLISSYLALIRLYHSNYHMLT